MGGWTGAASSEPIKLVFTVEDVPFFADRTYTISSNPEDVAVASSAMHASTIGVKSLAWRNHPLDAGIFRFNLARAAGMHILPVST